MSSPDAAGKDGSVSRPEGPQLDQRYPRSRRLTSRRQFLAVYAAGHRVGSRSFTVFGRPRPGGGTRLGLTVSKRVGGAVVRNRVKRVLREIFRRHRGRLDGSLDVVVNARPEITERGFEELEREFLSACRKLCGRLRS